MLEILLNYWFLFYIGVGLVVVFISIFLNTDFADTISSDYKNITDKDSLFFFGCGFYMADICTDCACINDYWWI